MNAKRLVFIILIVSFLALIFLLKLPFIISATIFTIIFIISTVSATLYSYAKQKQLNPLNSAIDLQKISRFRSYLFRLKDDILRKKGEELSETLRQIITLIQKNQQNLDTQMQIEYTALIENIDKSNAILAKFIDLNNTVNTDTNELNEKINSLFQDNAEAIKTFLNKLKQAQITNLESDILKMEKSIELDKYLKNQGIEENKEERKI